MSGYEKRKQLEEMMREPAPGKRVGIIHLHMVREERSLYGMGRIGNSQAAVEAVRPLIMMSDREMMVVMSLSTKREPLAVEIVAVGSLDGCMMSIGNIFKHSLLSNAASVICFHNHPSGDPTPSPCDYQSTERIREAGKLLGIELVDHIIIGAEAYYSFQDHGEIEGTGHDDMA